MADCPVRIVSPKVKKARMAPPQSELWSSDRRRSASAPSGRRARSEYDLLAGLLLKLKVAIASGSECCPAPERLSSGSRCVGLA